MEISKVGPKTCFSCIRKKAEKNDAISDQGILGQDKGEGKKLVKVVSPSSRSDGERGKKKGGGQVKKKNKVLFWRQRCPVT